MEPSSRTAWRRLRSRTLRNAALGFVFGVEGLPPALHPHFYSESVRVVYNDGSVQVVYDEFRNPVEIPPKFFIPFPLSMFKGVPYIRDVEQVDEVVEKSKFVMFARSYALGDVLMTIPIAREFKKKFPGKEIVLASGISHLPVTKILNEDVFSRILPWQSIFSDPNGRVGFFLDGILERDHLGSRESFINRIDLYREFFGLKIGEPPVWSEKKRFVGEEGIIFCSGGSKKIKQLPPETAEFLAEKLGSKYWQVVHINNGKLLPPEVVVEKIRNARAVVTMDSSPLWISHFTATPVVLLSGPTRGIERLSYHPLYPEGCAEVSLSRLTECEPCFERKVACGGEVACMKFPKEKLWPLVKEAVEKVAWKTK